MKTFVIALVVTSLITSAASASPAAAKATATKATATKKSSPKKNGGFFATANAGFGVIAFKAEEDSPAVAVVKGKLARLQLGYAYTKLGISYNLQMLTDGTGTISMHTIDLSNVSRSSGWHYRAGIGAMLLSAGGNTVAGLAGDIGIGYDLQLSGALHLSFDLPLALTVHQVGEVVLAGTMIGFQIGLSFRSRAN